MRVAWFTPLPPMPSGIADYSSEIVPYVAQRAEVDVFCPRPGLFSRAKVPAGARLQDPRRFESLLDQYDACFYHLGNNPYHEFVYKTAKDRPGIAVFHDADLHHLIAHATFESRRDYAGYEEVLREELGDRGGRVATLRRLGLATEFEKFIFPLTEHVASRARGIVVHSEDARLKMHEIAPDVPIAVVPHHAGEPPASVRAITREEARRRLGIPQDAFVVGHLGFITKPKQPGAVVGGFARLYREFPNSLLYMVGADRTGGALSKLVQDLGVGPAVRLAGYVDLEQFYLYLKALDAMINLRYPSAGESSGTFSRALAEGRAAIVNNYGSFAEVPGDVALKVQIDSPQAEQVGEHLLHLARDHEFRLALEQRAREYANTVLDPNRCRDLYLAFARKVGPPLPKAADTRLRIRPARRATLSEAVTRRHHLEPEIERVLSGAAGKAGSAIFIDVLYQLVLHRPATGDEIRDAHARLATGAVTRADLAAELTQSPEFMEVRLVEQLVQDALKEIPFRIDPGTPLGSGTSERVVEIPWLLSRVGLAGVALDASPNPSVLWTSSLLDAGIPSLNVASPAAALAADVRTVRAIAGALPYQDGIFDLVLAASIEIEAETLGELARVTSTGGRILLSTRQGSELDAAISGQPLRIEERDDFRSTSEGWVPSAGPADLACVSLVRT